MSIKQGGVYGREGGREGGRGTYHTHVHFSNVDEGAAVSLAGGTHAFFVEEVRNDCPDS